MRPLWYGCAVVLLVIVAASCRTTKPASTFSAATPEVAWQQLLAMRSSVAVQSLSRVRITEGETTRNFSARIAAANENFSITLMTPLGTAAATIYGDKDGVLVADHIHNTTWSGDVHSILGTGLRDIDARSLVLLAFGLPVGVETGSPCGSSNDCRAQNGIEYEISTRGLTEARDGSTVVRYGAPGVPPVSATLSVGGREMLLVEHRSFEPLNEPITAPDISGYRTIPAPR